MGQEVFNGKKPGFSKKKTLFSHYISRPQDILIKVIRYHSDNGKIMH
jgi:hypothetical protein